MKSILVPTRCNDVTHIEASVVHGFVVERPMPSSSLEMDLSTRNGFPEFVDDATADADGTVAGACSRRGSNDEDEARGAAFHVPSKQPGSSA
jgi:hypothetical protein